MVFPSIEQDYLVGVSITLTFEGTALTETILLILPILVVMLNWVFLVLGFTTKELLELLLEFIF